MIYAIAGSFASVFMLAKGYSNLHIGMTLAAANIVAMGLQPFIADYMDKAKGVTIIDTVAWSTLVMMMTCAGYFIFKSGTFMLALAIVMVLAIHALLQPLLNTLAFRLSESGVNVSFGLGRAGGSLGYSLIVAVLGTLVEKKGAMMMPVCIESACLLLIALLLLTKHSFNRIVRQAEAEASDGMQHAAEAARKRANAERIDIKAFVKRNKYFFIVNLGLAGLLFSNSVLSNYMPQIAGNVNGTTEQVGRILSLMALAEIPVMIFYDKIHKCFSSRTLIKVSSVGFTAKIAVCWLARSVKLLFAAQIFQFIGFALLMPAMVYYVNEIMSPGEAVKGQALFTMMLTFSTIAASFAGGWLLDAYSAGTLTFVSTIVTAAGAVIVILFIGKVKSHREQPDGF
jgi:PPP family 3-phenylpropionic acid transporter